MPSKEMPYLVIPGAFIFRTYQINLQHYQIVFIFYQIYLQFTVYAFFLSELVQNYQINSTKTKGFLLGNFDSSGVTKQLLFQNPISKSFVNQRRNQIGFFTNPRTFNCHD